MAKKKAPENFQVGDLVQLAECSDEHPTGCVGQVVSLGPPLIIAVHPFTFQPKQLKDELEIPWNDLRALAKSLDIPASGNRGQLEAKINKHFNDQERAVEVGPPTAPVRPPTQQSRATRGPTVMASRDVGVVSRGVSRGVGDAPADGFMTGQRVEVKSGDDSGVRGEVVDGSPRVQVELEGGGTSQFPASNLKKLPPILG